MRYATVGTSWITDAFIQGADISGGMELSAVYSRNEKRGKEFSEKYGGKPIFTDMQELAQSSLIDAVYIASPNVLHYKHSRLFLEHGKHVLCEKPATVTSAQQLELLKTAHLNRLVYMEAIMMRHLPARQLLLQALKKIGNISSARFDFSQLSSKYPAYLSGQLPNIFNPKMAAGCLMDLGVYCVYAAIDLFGLPKKITAESGFLKSGSDGFGSSVFEYNDKHIILTYSKIGQSEIGSEILGDQGTIAIESISKLTGITLIQNINGQQSKKTIVGEVDKPQLMSGEASAFKCFSSDPVKYSNDIRNINKLALDVCKTMEIMRQQAGIRFD